MTTGRFSFEWITGRTGFFLTLWLVVLLARAGGFQPIPDASASTTPLVDYAVYLRVADTDRLGANIPVSAMSGDGSRMAFVGVKPNRHYSLYTMKGDGTGLTEIPLPMLEGRAVAELAVSWNGRRVFMSTGGPGARFYLAEGGSVKMILDGSQHKGFEMLERIQCTADGSTLFFLNRQGYGGDIWRVNRDGSGLTKVVDDNQVHHAHSNGGKGYRVLEFGISADGSTVAFLLEGWFDPGNIHVRHSRPELFVLRGGSIRQLTRYEAPCRKHHLAVSSDGSTAAMLVAQPVNRWVAVHTGTGTLTSLGAPRGGGKSALSGDGRLLFLVEDGGTLMRTDGTGVMSLLAVSNLPLAVHDHPCISDDGTRVSFRFGYSAWPFKEAVYVGTFMNGPRPMRDAPAVSDVAFEPKFMPRGAPKNQVRLTARISDPQGPENIFRVGADPLLGGVRQNATMTPAIFNRGPNDAGVNGDRTADDGFFTSMGIPGPKVNEIDVMTLRIGAMDMEGNAAVSCVRFGIGAPAPTRPAAIAGKRDERSTGMAPTVQTRQDGYDERKTSGTPAASRDKTTVDQAKGYLDQGLLHAKENRYGDAVEAYTKGISLGTRYSPPLYYNRGLAYEKQSSHEQAIADYTEALRLNPKLAEAYLRRGFVYAVNLKQYDRAREDWEKALEIDPGGKTGQAARKNLQLLKGMK